jgi:TrmH family RNA methyltransferase
MTQLAQAITDKIHVILVNPQDNLNIGSVLRAMHNLGYNKLHLVACDIFDPARVRITACRAECLIPDIQFHSTLGEALQPMREVVGFSARSGRNRIHIESLPEYVGSFVSASSVVVNTAFVFGREDTGLLHEDLELCSRLVKIPAHGDYTSFNLAQAVLLALYSMREGLCGSKSEESVGGNLEPEQNELLAKWSDFQYLDSLVDSVLEYSRFYRKGTPQPIPGVVKRLMRRMRPTEREMGILLGMFRRIEGVLSGRVPIGERSIEKAIDKDYKG